MALDPIHAFYCSKKYLDLSLQLKLKSEGICSKCGKRFAISELRTHHIIELNLTNIDDVNITLNPANIEVICHDCHNKVHRRFGNIFNKKVYLVYGSPCSGKSSYVNQVATRYDLIVDLDKIHQSICVCDLYDKPDSTKRIAWDIRDLLLEKIRLRMGDWECAYIIGGYPSRYERDRIVREFGAELIHMDASQDECIDRCNRSTDREAVRNAYISYIKNYFSRYIP